MKQHYLLIRTLLFIGSFLITTTGFAVTENQYQVEVIIFEHVTQQGIESEAWPNNPQLPSFRNAINLQQATNNNALNQPTQLQNYQLLPASYFHLSQETNKLQRNPNYRILLHQTWLQPIGGERSAKPIHLYGGELFNSDGSVMTNDNNNLLPPPSDSYWQLNGTVTISMDRFFNVKTDFLLNEPISQLPTNTQQQADNYHFQPTNIKSFLLLQTRRMKSNELNYIDHPLFGILIAIYPYQATLQPQTSPKSL